MTFKITRFLVALVGVTLPGIPAMADSTRLRIESPAEGQMITTRRVAVSGACRSTTNTLELAIGSEAVEIRCVNSKFTHVVNYQAAGGNIGIRVRQSTPIGAVHEISVLFNPAP